MSFQIQKPKTARDAIRYFHAVALDYVTDLKKQSPNHDISIEPSQLPYDHQLNQLNIKVRVWDRTLKIEFEIFTKPQKDNGLLTYLLGTGSISLHPHFNILLYVLDRGKDEWLYSWNDQRGKTLDAGFLLERMQPLLDQLPD